MISGSSAPRDPPPPHMPYSLYHFISDDGFGANAERARAYKALQEERWRVGLRYYNIEMEKGEVRFVMFALLVDYIGLVRRWLRWAYTHLFHI